VEQATAAWAKGDRCDAAPKTERVTEHVRLEAYGNCAAGASVQLYVVEGGGHTWPGGKADVTLLGVTTHEVSATDVIWQFFASQPPLSR
jgi:polyhydroxybutyrate depolymerase